MKQMWSSWRSQYIDSFKDEKKDNSGCDCFICRAIKNTDVDKEKDFLVVKRQANCIALLNKYPYNNGHVLVAPLEHISDFTLLNSETLSEIMELIKRIIAIEKNMFNPAGFNVGVNIGQAAGAGLPGHLHFHVVPRWNGDSNFMAVCDDIKVISNDIMKLQNTLYNLLNQ